MSIIFSKHENHPDKILIRTFKGVLATTDILNSWEEVNQRQLITPKTIGIINDLTDCELVVDMSNFSMIISYMKAHKELHRIKLAVITYSPSVIVFPILIGSYVHELSIKPFSTRRAAEYWILNGA